MASRRQNPAGSGLKKPRRTPTHPSGGSMTATSILTRASHKPIPQLSLLESLAWVTGFRNHALRIVQSSHDRYGPAVRNGVGFMTGISLFGPDANRFVLLDRDGLLSARGAWELIMGRIFGGGLLLRDGEDHRRQRRIMRAAFQSEVLAEYCERMNPRIARGIEGWLAGGTRLLAFPAYKELTLDLAFDIFVGVELGAQAQRLGRWFEATVAASMSILRLPIPGLEFQRGLEGRRRMGEYFASLIPARREAPGTDMLSRLCRADPATGEGLTDREIVDHMNFLMMAAHDTTSSTLTSLTYLLGRHPEWQERARRESLALGDEMLAYQHQDQLPSLTQALHETLRLYPPLSAIPRLALEEFGFDGYRVPKGSMVSIFPIHTHRMPEWWTAPERFDPERFARERQEHRRHTHLYVPFGGGAHMCLGLRFAEMQVRAVMHQLLRRARWELAPGYVMPVQEAPISKPRDGLPIRLTPLDGTR